MGCASSTADGERLAGAGAAGHIHSKQQQHQQPSLQQQQFSQQRADAYLVSPSKAPDTSENKAATPHGAAAAVAPFGGTTLSADAAVQATFGQELAKIISEATNGTKSKDAWAILYKSTELMCQTFGLQACSIVVYTTSGLYCKVASNSGSPLLELLQQHPDLMPTGIMGWTTSVASTMKTTCIKSGDEAWARLQRDELVDFTLLGVRGGCNSLAVVPLMCGDQPPRCLGAIVLGHAQAAALAAVLQQCWLTIFVPMLSLYVHDSHIIRNISVVEKIVEAASLNSLAYTATLELGDIFDWCHKEDLETRLVVLSQDASDMVTVYCKLPSASMGTDDRSSFMRSDVESQVTQSSRVPGATSEEGLVGTQMSLDNTLTKRCLTGRQRLLFVADVMQALKLYGEPWKDIFFESGTVMTPCWVLAAPLVHDGKKLGAVLWLCSCRVNSEVLMRTASSYASPIIHAVTRAVMGHLYGLPGYSSIDGPGMGGLAAAGVRAGMSSAMSAVTSFTALSSPHSMSSAVSRRSRQRSGADMGSDVDGGGSASADVPVRYVVRHSPSTSALMRMYKSTIAQRAPAGADESSQRSIHEIRILSKAGEGAFGSVYVGRWRNIVVAVKIIKDNSGTRALKTAWELAVNKSLAHPSIVTVHAILTDVHLQKSSAKVLRFVPASAIEAANALAPAPPTPATLPPTGASAGAPGMAPSPEALQGLSSKLSAPARLQGEGDGGVQGLAGSNSFNNDGAAPGTPTGSSSAQGSAASAAKLNNKPLTPKVHAILMEYCNLGGLHKYIDNRQFFKEKALLDNVTDANLGSIPIPPEALHMDFILATLSEVASALQYLHAQGFVHCDLKPENVLLKEANNRRGFTAKLADFGLSELRTADGQVVGDLGGTVTHVAPESVLHRQVSTSSDMYAFGVLMWELYTGQQPYRTLLAHISKREDRHRALLARVVHEGLRPVFPPATPPEYLAMATSCWSADPLLRPTTTQVITALEEMYGKYTQLQPQPQQPGLPPQPQLQPLAPQQFAPQVAGAPNVQAAGVPGNYAV